MSFNDRAAYMSASRPRAVSNRVDAETRGVSPIQIENKNPLRNSSSSQNHRGSRAQKSMSENQPDRPVRRKPIKESISNTNRSDWDKNRPRKPALADGASPNARDGEKNLASCE